MAKRIDMADVAAKIFKDMGWENLVLSPFALGMIVLIVDDKCPEYVEGREPFSPLIHDMIFDAVYEEIGKMSAAWNEYYSQFDCKSFK